VTLRLNLSVGLPFDSYLAAFSAMAFLVCASRDRGAQEREVRRTASAIDYQQWLGKL
jgi:hypothetical protein